MVRLALTAALAAPLLLTGGAASADDPAASAPYPLPNEQAAPAPHPRRHAPAAPRRPERPAAVPLPARDPRPAAGAVAARAAVSSAREPSAFAPPIGLGGRNEWRVVTDAATGIVIGLPGRLLTQSHDAAHGTAWSSPHGEMRLETFRYTDPSLTLPALFEREKRAPAVRRVEYGNLKDDSFAVGGLQGLKNFSVRATARNGEIRGFALTYDQAMEGIAAPVLAAMATAFTPFPERPAPFAHPERPVEYGSGVVVSKRGDILTSARLAQPCVSLIAGGLGRAERIAAGDGLALLRVYGATKLSPLAPSGGAAGDLTLVGVPDPREQQGRDGLRDLSARAFGDTLALARPLPLAGYAGAAALDAQERLAGLVELSGTQVASAGAPPLRLIGAAAIRRFLAAHGVEPPAPSGSARAAVVRVICVR